MRLGQLQHNKGLGATLLRSEEDVGFKFVIGGHESARLLQALSDHWWT